MGGLFSKPKAPKIPPAPAPPPPPPPPDPLPTVSSDTGDAEVKKTQRRSGYSKTIVTGALTPAESGKKKVLG